MITFCYLPLWQKSNELNTKNPYRGVRRNTSPLKLFTKATGYVATTEKEKLQYDRICNEQTCAE